MTDEPFVKSLGELRVERTLGSDPAMPSVEAVHPDGRTMRARVLVFAEEMPHEARSAFEAAAAAAAQLDHPSLAVPRVWSSGPPCFAAVDALDGVTLSSWIESAPDMLDVPLAAALAVDIARALAAAHAASLVHGGVGLDSIFVLRTGRPVLTDFAIAALGGTLANSYSQFLGFVVMHMAPEQVDTPGATAATDVFALGSMLYRLLTGKFPFDAPSPLGITLALSMGSFDPVEASAPDVPDQLRELVHAMLSTAPGDRPDAAKVAAELSRIAAPDEEDRHDALRSLFFPGETAPAPPAPHVSQPSPAERVVLPEAAPPAPAPKAVGPPTVRDLASAIAAPSAGPPEPERWVESAGFDDAPTEFDPQFFGAEHAGATPPTMVMSPATYPQPAANASFAGPDRASSAPVRHEAPPVHRGSVRSDGSPSPLVWIAVAVVAFLILGAATLTAIALAS